jgi:uncharacterized membrane protein YfhO
MLNTGHYTPAKSGNKWEELQLAFKDWAADFSASANNFFRNFSVNMKKTWAKMRASDKWQITGWLALIAFLCFAQTMFLNSFTIPIAGDFRYQGMAFIYNGYDDWHYFFRTGVFPMWDTSGLLGVDNVDAYSFYYLFDPFFLALLIWPRAWLNQMQAIFMLVKLVLAGLFFYEYLGSFHITKQTRKVGAVAYAFCGWGWFYLWFFHFEEVATFFPLMLLGIEKIIQKKDPRLYMVAMFLMGATNYQFLAIFTVFCFIYAIWRYCETFKTRSAEDNLKVIWMGFYSFAIGLMICCYIIWPNFLSVKNMPRFSSASYITSLKSATSWNAFWKLIFVWPDSVSYRRYYPLMSLLFINTNCFSEALIKSNSGYDNAGSSIYILAPLLVMLVPSIIDALRKKQFSEIWALVLLAVCLETPFIYYASGGFANAYGRWELVASAIAILFVCKHFDNIKEMPRWYFDISIAVIAIAMGFTIKAAFSDATTYASLKALSEAVTIFGKTGNYYYAVVVYECLYIFCCYLFLRFLGHSEKIKKEVFFLAAVEAIIMGNVTVQGQGTNSYSAAVFGGHDNYTQQTNIIQNLNSWDPTFYRVFNTQMTRMDNNLAMAEGYNGIGTFSSVYNYDSEDLFKYWSRISYNNSWSFGVHEKRNNLDELLGVKYVLVGKTDTFQANGLGGTTKTFDTNIPYGYTDVTTLADCPSSLKSLLYSASNPNGNFLLYRNDNFIDMAFAYDTYQTSLLMSQGSANENVNEINYLKRAIVDSDYLDANTEKFADFSQADTLASITRDTNVSALQTVYSSRWDVQATDGDGNLRTINANYSDKAYSIVHQDEIKADISANGDANYIFYQDSAGNPTETVTQDEVTYTVFHHRSNQFFIFPSDVSQTYGTGLKWLSKISLENKSNGVPAAIAAPDAYARNGAYVSIESLFGYNIDFYLYGYDVLKGTYHLLTHDQHMQNNFDKSYDWKYARGFYVTEPVYKIVGVVKETGVDITVNAISYEYNDEYQADVDALKANAVTVDYKTKTANTINYISNYAKKKIVVLNIPYSSGWTLKRKTASNTASESVELFKAQGGLIGYIAGAGEESYTLHYETPGFKKGLAVTGVGLALQGVISAYWYGKKKIAKDMKLFSESYSLKGL